MNSDFKIIVITSPDEALDEVAKVTRLLDVGLDRLHIRKPGWSRARIRDFVLSIPEECRHRVSIHNNPGLAAELGCGIHGTASGDALPHHIKEISLCRSKSCHELTQLTVTDGYDYLFLSPIFDSISKNGYTARFSPYSIDLSGSSSPVIALGGVTLKNLELLKNAGFAGAAFLGQVWNLEGGYEEMLRFLRMRNVSFQFITNASDVQTTVEQAENALKGGCRWIQVRMKDSSSLDIAEALKQISSIRRKYGGATLIVDDHCELLKHDEVDGVHLGQLDLPPSEARKFGDSSKIIGLTVNSPDHLIGASYAEVDYYGIGPFRFTSTKRKLAPVLGTEGYMKINTAMNALADRRPYVAIGGITANDIEPLCKAGVKGFALSGAIAAALDPIAATRNLINKIYNYE